MLGTQEKVGGEAEHGEDAEGAEVEEEKTYNLQLDVGEKSVEKTSFGNNQKKDIDFYIFVKLGYHFGPPSATPKSPRSRPKATLDRTFCYF